MFHLEFPATVDAAEIRSALNAFLTRIGAKPAPDTAEFVDVKIRGLAGVHRLSVEVTCCAPLDEQQEFFCRDKKAVAT